eukprot:scaffold436778_cov45-Prasinocladus_malaysianus.AAC.1
MGLDAHGPGAKLEGLLRLLRVLPDVRSCQHQAGLCVAAQGFLRTRDRQSGATRAYTSKECRSKRRWGERTYAKMQDRIRKLTATSIESHDDFSRKTATVITKSLLLSHRK